MISENQARKYCYQDISLIENYDKAVADKEHIWHCHHRLETIMNCGHKELKAQGCYYDRPAHELIFLTHEEHTSIHKHGNRNWVGRKHSEETRRKMSVAQKGNKYAFGCHRSEETKRKLSEAMKLYWEKRRNLI